MRTAEGLTILYPPNLFAQFEWTAELHAKFVEVVNELGTNVTPPPAPRGHACNPARMLLGPCMYVHRLRVFGSVGGVC